MDDNFMSPSVPTSIRLNKTCKKSFKTLELLFSINGIYLSSTWVMMISFSSSGKRAGTIPDVSMLLIDSRKPKTKIIQN